MNSEILKISNSVGFTSFTWESVNKQWIIDVLLYSIAEIKSRQYVRWWRIFVSVIESLKYHLQIYDLWRIVNFSVSLLRTLNIFFLKVNSLTNVLCWTTSFWVICQNIFCVFRWIKFISFTNFVFFSSSQH